MKNCSDCSRREFLRLSVGMSSAAMLAAKFGIPLGAQESTVVAGKAKRAILLWMMGAPSQMDTWDLKPGAETGGPFKAIQTSAPGIQICEHMPLIAKQMKNVSLIRTVNSKDPNHDTAQYMLHTAYRRAADVEHPHLGAVVAHELGIAVQDLPGAVVLGSTPPTGAGYLPTEFGPLVLDKIGAPAEDLLANPNSSRDRLESRWKLLNRFDRKFLEEHEDLLVEQRRRSYEKAHQVLTSDRVKAFDVKLEKEETRRLYGDSDYGRALLMSRRLVEAGVRFVEVMYGNWDTHVDNFTAVQQLLKETDQPIAALLQDLAQRDMLKDTLVVWMGEFGRTPRINDNNGRDHWTTWSVALAGGGIQGGRVIGKTDDKGLAIADRGVSVTDLYSTFFHAFGVNPAKNLITVPRPMKVVDGGSPVRELF